MIRKGNMTEMIQINLKIFQKTDIKWSQIQHQHPLKDCARKDNFEK